MPKFSALTAMVSQAASDIFAFAANGRSWRETRQQLADWVVQTATSFLQFGSGATSRTVQAKGREILSVEDFGAVGDGSTDDTSAIAAAITEAKSSGRKLYFKSKVYKCNITITGENVHLEATSFAYNAVATVGLVPATLTSPVIQIGDGTTTTRDITLNGFSLYGSNTGDKGLRIYGADNVYVNGFSVLAFEEYAVQLDSSATKSTFFIFFNGYHIANGTTAGSLGLDFNYGSSFTAAVYFTNGAWNAQAGGSFLIDLNGSGAAVNLANAWIEADDDQGINFGSGTKVICANVKVDSNSAADSLATIATNTSPSVYLQGMVDVDGVVTMPGGDTIALTSRMLIPNEALLNNPHVTGGLSFQDSNANAWEQTQTGNQNQRLTRSGTSLVIVSSDGDVRITSSTGLHLNGGSLRLVDGITAPSATAGQAKIYVDTSDGDLKVIFGDGTIKTIVVDT
jgi:hypothetical protein